MTNDMMFGELDLEVRLKELEREVQYCAKPYEIRSVSPNGVVRVGKKNSKVSYRMKDVREISQELPLFEDFNREIFMQMRNKFRKFDKDVLGRIIYNIYIGTFGEYI